MTTKTTLPLIEIDSVHYDDDNLTIQYFDGSQRRFVEFPGQEVRYYFQHITFDDNLSQETIDLMGEQFLILKFNLKEKAENTELKKIAEKATGSLLAIILKVDEMLDAIPQYANNSLDGVKDAARLRALKEIKDELKSLMI